MVVRGGPFRGIGSKRTRITKVSEGVKIEKSATARSQIEGTKEFKERRKRSRERKDVVGPATQKTLETVKAREEAKARKVQRFIGPKQADFFKKPLVDEQKATTVSRAGLQVATSPESEKKEFLQDVKRTSPEAFEKFALGEAEVEETRRAIPSKIREGERDKEIVTGVVPGVGEQLSPVAPEEFFRKKAPSILDLETRTETIQEPGTVFTPKAEETTLRLVPTEEVKRKSQDILAKAEGLPEVSEEFKQVRLGTTDVSGQKTLFPSKEREFKPSEEAVIKGLAEFENTKLKNEQLNKRIEEFNLLPVTQQDERELSNLKQQREDIGSRFRLNPFVEEKNGTFVFASPIVSDVIAEQKKISGAPDIFIPESALREAVPETQFGKGFKEAQAGEGIFITSFREATPFEKAQRAAGITAGAALSPFLGTKGAQDVTFRAVGEPLEKIGVSEPIARRVSEAGLGVVSTVALAPVGGAVGRGAGLVAAKVPTVAKVGAGVGKIASSKIAQIGLGGLLAADVGQEAIRGFEETGTLGGAASFAGAEVAELAALAVPIGAGVKGFKSVKAAGLERQAAELAKGKGVDVILTKGVSTTAISPQAKVVRAVSESEGVIKVGGRSIKVKVFTGAEGRQTLAGPGQVDDILRITGGQVKVEFPKSRRKPILFQTATDLSKLPSGNIKGTTILTDAAGEETVLRTITGRRPGVKGTELQETIGFTREKPGLLTEEATQLGKSIAFQKTPQILSTPAGSLAITEAEFATGTIQAKSGKSLTETLKGLVKPPKIGPEVQFRTRAPTTKRTRTPIGEPVKPVETTTGIKKPVQQFQQPVQELQPVARGISEGQTLTTAQKLKRVVGQQEATRIRGQAKKLKLEPVPFKKTITPITTMDQLQALRISQTKTLATPKQTTVSPLLTQEPIFQQAFQRQVPVQEKVEQKVIQQPIFDVQRPIQEVITAEPVQELKPVSPPPPSITPLVGAGLLGAGGIGLPGGIGGITPTRTVLGVKVNPIDSISKGIGKNIRKINF